MKFDYEAFDKWENENHIPEQVKRIVNAVLKSEGYEEPFGEIDTDCRDTTNEETIAIHNRGGHVIGYGKGFSMSYCTSSLECGSDVDCKYLINFIRGLGFVIENSHGDNGMDSSTNWHDTWWSYDFMYKPSEVYEEKFIIWEDKDYSD
jgi:hypothetical protein